MLTNTPVPYDFCVGRGLLRDCTTSPINRFSALVITRMDSTHLMTSFSWAGMRRLEWADSSPDTSVTTELFRTEEEGACHQLDTQHLSSIHFGFALGLKSTAMGLVVIGTVH